MVARTAKTDVPNEEMLSHDRATRLLTMSAIKLGSAEGTVPLEAVHGAELADGNSRNSAHARILDAIVEADAGEGDEEPEGNTET